MKRCFKQQNITLLLPPTFSGHWIENTNVEIENRSVGYYQDNLLLNASRQTQCNIFFNFIFITSSLTIFTSRDVIEDICTSAAF